MIRPALNAWLIALAVMVAVPVFATPTGGGGGGGITILPSAHLAAAGTVLDRKDLDQYGATGTRINMPFSSATSVSLMLHGVEDPAFTWVVTDANSFVLPSAVMSQLWESGDHRFALKFDSVEGLQFEVSINLQSSEKAAIVALR